MAGDERPDPMQRFPRGSSWDSRRPAWWEVDAQRWGESFKRIRLPIAAAAVLGLLLFFGPLSSGGGVFVLVIAAWWAGPFVLYLLFFNSRIGSLVFGVALAVATGAELVWILDLMERSSTGGIAFLTLPVLTYPAVGVAIVIDRLLAWREDRGEIPRLFLAGGGGVVGVATVLLLWNASEQVVS
ncbi:MAG: hypothetical protein M3217_02360, partial [Actinomycetota bacterium]|nr:hypothetical protein [Actinomycetota bacterium]